MCQRASDDLTVKRSGVFLVHFCPSNPIGSMGLVLQIQMVRLLPSDESMLLDGDKFLGPLMKQHDLRACDCRACLRKKTL